MRVVSFHSWGEFIGDPENKASQKLNKWVKECKISMNPIKHQVFGFNNPSPKIANTGEQFANKDNPYGYEFWLIISKNFKIDGSMNVKLVESGLYTVISIKGLDDICNGWKQLIDWIQKSEKYDFNPNWKGLREYYLKNHFKYGITGLEHHINYPENDEKKFLIDIYAQIIEKK